jgi:hypothetical protein
MALELDLGTDVDVAALLAWTESDNHFGKTYGDEDEPDSPKPGPIGLPQFGIFDDEALRDVPIEVPRNVDMVNGLLESFKFFEETVGNKSPPSTEEVPRVSTPGVGFRYVDPARKQVRAALRTAFKAAHLAASAGMGLGGRVKDHFRRLMREREVFLGREEKAVAYQFAAEMEYDDIDFEVEEKSIPGEFEPVKPKSSVARRTRRERARLRYWVRKAIMHFPLRPNTEAMRGTVFKWVSAQMCEAGWSTQHAFAYAWLVAGLAIAGLEEERLAREIARPKVSWLARLLGYGGAPATGG